MGRSPPDIDQLGVWGAVSPPQQVRGRAPGSYRLLEHLDVFEEVLEDKMSEFLRSIMLQLSKYNRKSGKNLRKNHHSLKGCLTR